MARDESVMAAIEMAAERPTGALRGVCTHVRLSPFAWRRQGMPPECRQRHTSAGPLIFARTAGRYEGYWQDTAATAATARWASIEDWLVPCQQLCEVTSRRYRKSSCSSSSALSTARSGLTLAGAADATPAIHRCVRYRTLCSSHLSRGQHLRYRSPSENQTTLSDQETSMHPHGRGIARLRQFITCGCPTAFKRSSINSYNSHFRRTTNNMVVTGSGSLWRSDALSGSWFTPCVARCQTNLEHEQVQAIQDPFSGTLSFFLLIRQIALLGASATLTYRFQLDESYIRCHVFMVISKLCQSHHDER